MSVTLIFISLVTLTTIFYLVNDNNENSLRISLIKSSLCHGLIIVLFTEFLSLNYELTFFSLFVEWSLIAIINIAFLFFLINQRKYVLKKPRFWERFKKLQLIDQIPIIFTFIIIFICLITALIAPPNNYDSMTYHMSKVMHWIQNGTVAHYPTSNLRQISFFPGAEYIIAHLQILSGGDYFANGVQWFALLGCILGISLIAKEIGEPQIQSTSILVCASIPIVIMQSTTTQNDLICAYWLVCLTYFILKSSNYSKQDFFWIAIAFGLSILTKATAFILSFPLLIVFGLRLLKQLLKSNNIKQSFLRTIFIGTSVVACGIILSLPTYLRNNFTFGSFLGIDGGTKVETISLTTAISNILKNLATNFPFSWSWMLVIKLHEHILKLNYKDILIVPIDNNIIWRFLIPDENFVSSPIHIILFFISISFILILARKSKINFQNKLLIFIIVIISQFFVFSLLINWQPWINRLFIICCILGSLPIGFLLKEIHKKTKLKIVSYLLIFILGIEGIFYSLTPIHHPLIALDPKRTHWSQSESILTLDRQDIYFSGSDKKMKPIYTNIVNQLIKDKCYSIGIKIGGDQLEYPLWVLMKSQSQDNEVRIQHIEVDNESVKNPIEFPYSEICGGIRFVVK